MLGQTIHYKQIFYVQKYILYIRTRSNLYTFATTAENGDDDGDDNNLKLLVATELMCSLLNVYDENYTFCLLLLFHTCELIYPQRTYATTTPYLLFLCRWIRYSHVLKIFGARQRPFRL